MVAFGQTQSDKAKKEEQLKKLKEDLLKEQQILQQQQEWNQHSTKQAVDQLSKENQEKSQQLKRSNEEILRSQQELERKRKEIEAKQRELEQSEEKLSLSQEEIERARALQKMQEDSINLLQQAKKIQDLELAKKDLEVIQEREKRKFYIYGFALVGVIITVLIGLFLAIQRNNRQLADKNKIIEEEKKRSDDLLLNILPEEVMHELKTYGKTQAKNYPLATVLFADIKDFTHISELLPPEDLIAGLDTYFEAFDKIIEKYNIEKIKTIGDAYVCAGGVPIENQDNPHKVVEAALQFKAAVERLRKDRETAGKIPFEFRIGVHTGPLVAGVVGIRKFAYDIWGDTVNVAARMQQHGETNKINISGATYEIVKDKFACVYRGKLEAKNKGQIDMYFVEKAI